jgi:hypothetical protein
MLWRSWCCRSSLLDVVVSHTIQKDPGSLCIGSGEENHAYPDQGMVSAIIVRN